MMYLWLNALPDQERMAIKNSKSILAEATFVPEIATLPASSREKQEPT
jgi:hypothetical protein